MSVQIPQEHSARLQADVQAELERREWAEPNADTVMAEYVTVLLVNGSARERVQAEMEDLVGGDFDANFLDWLYARASAIAGPTAVSSVPQSTAPETPAQPQESKQESNRLLSSALAPVTSQAAEKRKLPDSAQEGQNKRAAPAVPSGPRTGPAAGNGAPVRGQGMGIRGMAGSGRGGLASGNGSNGFHQQQPGFRPRPPMQQGRFNGPAPGMFGMPGQQEMMAQMMMMQANMAQMGQMMSMMTGQRQNQSQAPQQGGFRPRPPPPVELPPGTKLGSHAVSSITPGKATTGPIPTKPTSTALCKFGVGCSNSRCIYSHPSPVADEKNGMVLSEEACEKGKDCKDAECIKSHVSPAASGDISGPSKILCKYQNCTNPSCPFRHEDANGNPIPPPALAGKAATNGNGAIVPAPSSDDGSVEVITSHKTLMNSSLDDGPRVVQCRYAERCTRADCKFSHPPSRPVPKGHNSKSFKPSSFSSTPSTSTDIASAGMHKSKKFGTETKLNPSAGDFKPASTA
ncbi:hypothetical protein L202_02399 [Cryptococcus amylolentus CBS 6039]|uniref:C3H1-type domain-containing protein n=1 Tax=Cryptococcus amylolentus CBS 6039 TaxID=1295533 RepID=A0A1E3I0C7_9TREE|nr:hypothetical protein L202_02399 [Cryptococcus amylolentus CBS 6039]ODN82084.1 hypothetical protein L202_02399 [Cryptococcus amylolentus CBS 6039]